MTSSDEALNRSRSVADLVAVIWMLADDHEDADLPYQTSIRNERWWADAARIAGHRAPSQDTRTLVVEELCRRVQEARGGRPDECAGDEIECQNGRQRQARGADYIERDCPTCHGSGKHPCTVCGDPDSPGVVVLPGGYLACWTCAEDEDYGHPALARHARLLESANLAVDQAGQHVQDRRRVRHRISRLERRPVPTR